MAMPRACLSIVLLAFSIVCSCGKSGVLPSGPFPSLPWLADRDSSSLVLILNGNEDLQRSDNATEFGTELQLDAITSAAEYAIYVLNAGSTPSLLAVTVDDTNSTEFWVGVCNYSINRWDFSGPMAVSQTIPLTSDNHSPLGNVPVAILTVSGENVRITKVEVTIDNVPPIGDLQASAGGPAPVQIDFDASGSTDSDGTVEQYEWDWENDGTFDDSTSVPTNLHTYAVAGTYTCLLRVTDNGGATATASTQIAVSAPGNQPPSADLQSSGGGTAPATVDFDASGSTDSDGSITQYEWDWEDDGIFDDLTVQSTIQHVYGVEGDYTCRVRITDDGGLTASATTSITVTPPLNLPPIAVLTGPESGFPPFTADLDAGLSSDPDGTIVNFSWDLDNDGLFNVTPEEMASEGMSTASASVTEEGSFVFSVEVTDDEGLSDTATTTVRGTYWKTLTIASQDRVGEYCKLTEAGGHPSISSRIREADGSFGIVYTYSSTPTGENEADWSSLTLWMNDSFGAGTSAILEVQGNPAIAHSNELGLCYSRSSTPDGADLSDWETVTVDGLSVASPQSMVLVDGNPAIAYTRDKICYVRSSTPLGTEQTDWSSPVIIDPTSSAIGVSLQELSAGPAVAYHRGASPRVWFAYSSTSDGTGAGDWTSYQLDANPSMGASMVTLLNGHPAIAYNPGTLGGVKFAYCTSLNGETPGDWTFVDLDATDDDGGFGSLTLCEGKPAIAYRTVGPSGWDDIRSYSSSTDTGQDSADWPLEPLVADTGAIYASTPSIAEIGGKLAIAYYEDFVFSSTENLKYAIYLGP